MKGYENNAVIHRTYGRGIITSISDKYIWVRFTEKETKFAFPGVFEKYLTFEERELQEQIEKELSKKTDITILEGHQAISDQRTCQNTDIKDIPGKNRRNSWIRDSETGIYILNFQAPTTYSALKRCYYEWDGRTNLEELLDSDEEESVGWSVPRYAEVGDRVIFLCARSSIDSNHLNKAIREAEEYEDWDVADFGIDEREEYKEYAGKFLCVGKIHGFYPGKEYNQSLVFAEIGELQFMENLVTSKEVNSYIKLNSFGSVTSLNRDQWDKLKTLFKERNPEMNL